MRKHIFNPGPSVLPIEVLREASEAVTDINGIGESILEISHRGSLFEDAVAEAKSLVRELLGVTDDYEVLFLQGGASLQFAMIPMNFLKGSEMAAYLDTGTWASKAIKEAKLFGKVEVTASSKENNYNYIPKGYDIPETAKYFHITTNNTIYGTQIYDFPLSPTLLFADMSSDFLSRQVDASKFDLIYAGAQKNVGPAGVTLVIIRKELLKMINKPLPSMLDYKVFAENDSLYNTPCVFGIYVCLLTLRWLKKQGGVKSIEALNNTKAEMLYQVIDAYSLYKGHSVKHDRSKMNVTFTLTQPELEIEFLKTCDEANITGIKGHRSVGGFRASLYNALPMESVEVLCQVMKNFAERHETTGLVASEKRIKS